MAQNTDNIESTSTSKKGRGARRTAAALALLLIGSLAGLYFLFQDSDEAKTGLKNANSQIQELQEQNAQLKIELDTTKLNLRRERELRRHAESENDTLKSMFPLYVTSLEVGNADGSGRIIGGYGKDISAASSMYLMPRITYIGLRPGGKVELMVRLYDNEGRLVTGANSPNGYSYSYKIDPVGINENTVSLSGWGGGDKGHFEPGVYRYEVWLGDMCLKQKFFKLK